jgi:hypothetical protein
MKKNFFKKKLASGLAIALVVASISMPNYASAATATTIVKQGGAAAPAVVYVGGEKVDFGLSKTVSGNTYTWTTSDSKIATISKAGVVTAKAPGKVTIKSTIRDAKGKWLKAVTKTLTVNLRSTSVDAKSDDFSLYMSETKDLNAVKTPSNSTDAVRYYSDNTAVATVNAKTGVVTAVGVGEATITVYAKATAKSATASKYNKTDSVKVTVVDGIQTIKQTVTNKLELTFATDQTSKLTKDNLVITSAEGVKQVIDSISFSSDGKTVTVETFLNFDDGVTYKAAYNNTDKTFVASVGDPASIVVSDKTVQYATETSLSVKLLDKNGVDVTDNEDISDIDFDYDESKAYVEYDSTDDEFDITTFNYPDSVTLKATYYTGEYATDGTEKTFVASATIKSVEELAKTATDIKYTLIDDTSADWTKVNTKLPATSEGYRLFIDAEDQDGNALDEADFDYVSTDTDVLTVDDTGSVVYVYGINPGTAYIKATYEDTTKMLAVTVGSESKAATISADKTTITLYDSLSPADSATVDLTVKDQYGNELNDASESVDPDFRSGDSESLIDVTPLADGKVSFTLNGAASDSTDGTNTYKLTYYDKTISVTVKVVNVDTALPVSYIGIEKNDSTLDAALTTDTTSGVDTQFTVFSYNSKGQKLGVMTNAQFKLYKDGDEITADPEDENVGWTDAAGVATFAALRTTGSVATQASVGTYTIKASADIDPLATVTNTKSVTTSIVVKNTQDMPTFTWDNSKVSSGTLLQLADKAFTFELNDTDLTNIVGIEAVVNGAKTTVGTTHVSDGQSVRVNSVTVQDRIGSVTINYVVNVNKTVVIDD